MTQQQFAKMMKTAREKSGKTQGEICAKLGYTSPQFLSNFERGLCVLPLWALKKYGPMIGVSTGKIHDCLISIENARIKKGLGLQ